MPPATRETCEFEGCNYVTPENRTTIRDVIETMQLHHNAAHNNRPNEARINTGTITKPMTVPTCGNKMSLKDYIQEITEWRDATPSMTETQKQRLVLDSISKNTDRVAEKDHLDANTARLAANRTVDRVVEILKERFKLSDDQEYDMFLKELNDIDDDVSTDLWNNVEKLMTRFKDLKIAERPNYFFWRFMNKIGMKKNIWTAVEEREILATIKDKADNEIQEILRKNYKRIVVSNDPKVTETHFSKNRHFRKWNPDHKSGDQNDRRSRSQSRNDRNGPRKEESRTRYDSKNRFDSKNRSDSKGNSSDEKSKKEE